MWKKNNNNLLFEHHIYVSTGIETEKEKISKVWSLLWGEDHELITKKYSYNRGK